MGPRGKPHLPSKNKEILDVYIPCSTNIKRIRTENSNPPCPHFKNIHSRPFGQYLSRSPHSVGKQDFMVEDRSQENNKGQSFPILRPLSAWLLPAPFPSQRLGSSQHFVYTTHIQKQRILRAYRGTTTVERHSPIYISLCSSCFLGTKFVHAKQIWL